MEQKLRDEKVQHMHTVAERMYREAPCLGLDAETMYVLGFLHDIGRVRAKTRHACDGAVLLQKAGLPEELYVPVALHGNRLDKMKNPSKETMLLTACDLRTDWQGNPVTFKERLEGIRKGLGEKSKEYQTAEANVRYLEKHAWW